MGNDRLEVSAHVLAGGYLSPLFYYRRQNRNKAGVVQLFGQAFVFLRPSAALVAYDCVRCSHCGTMRLDLEPPATLDGIVSECGASLLQGSSD